MTVHWFSEETYFDEFILSGDIGGTNTSIALLGRKARAFTVLGKFMFRSQEIDGIELPLRQVLQQIRERHSEYRPEKCCLSGAGPVKNNHCRITNVPWEIDGNKIEHDLGIRTVVINDFMAVSYGISLIDVNDPLQVTRLAHPDGSMPDPYGPVRAVVGAGTGLGVGYLTEVGGKVVAYASEGGHSDFAPFSSVTREMRSFLESRWGEYMGAEAFVSGQGIANIFNFFTATKRIPHSGVIREIAAVTDTEKPALISRYAENDEHCRQIMKLFISMYGKFAGNTALFYFPTGGMYIAGGIVTKNEHLFLKDHTFMTHFSMNYRENIARTLRTFPVYLLKDYSVSLYGAAQAAYSLL